MSHWFETLLGVFVFFLVVLFGLFVVVVITVGILHCCYSPEAAPTFRGEKAAQFNYANYCLMTAETIEYDGHRFIVFCSCGCYQVIPHPDNEK